MGRDFAIVAEGHLRADRDVLRRQTDRHHHQQQAPERFHREPPARGSGTTLSATCWRRRVFSCAISVLRRAICSRSSELYRILPRAGCGAGFFNVITKPASTMPPPIMPPSRMDADPRSPCASADVPASAIPVYTSARPIGRQLLGDRKSTRLNSSHDQISYAVFCLKKKKAHHRLVAGPAIPTQ